jgi:hypothetical protein
MRSNDKAALAANGMEEAVLRQFAAALGVSVGLQHPQPGQQQQRQPA